MKLLPRISTTVALPLSGALLLVLFAAATGHAQEKTKISISGWLRLGAEYVYNERYSESFYRGKVQYDVALSKTLEAQLDLRGESTSHNLEVREAFLTVDLGKVKGLDFGQGKIRFGSEYQKNKEDLLTLERTLIFRHLESFGFAGRDLNFRLYARAREGTRRSGYTASLGYSEAFDLTLSAHGARLRTLGSFAAGASMLLQLDQKDAGRQLVWAAGLDLQRDTEAHRVELEGVFGQDPFATEFEATFGNGRKVYFLGGKALYGHRFTLNRALVKAVEPVLAASFLARDVEEIEWNTLQYLAGLNFHLGKGARLSINGDFLLANSPIDHRKRTYAGSNGILMMEVRW